MCHTKQSSPYYQIYVICIDAPQNNFDFLTFSNAMKYGILGVVSAITYRQIKMNILDNFGGQNEKIGHDISDLLRPNCPLDRLTNDNNSKINPDNTNKMGTMASTFFFGILALRSTIFQDSSFICQAKIICHLLFEQNIIENLLFRANSEIEMADLFFF